MSKMKSTLIDMDIPILVSVVFLITIGVFSIYSSGITAEGVLVSKEYLKQLLWAFSGLVIMIVVVSYDYKRIKDYSFIIYIIFIAILLYTRLFGRVVNGARSWLGIGEIGIQPAEFMKIATILFLANYLENSENEKSFRRLLVSLGIVLLPVSLILLQPDFGTSLVFFPILIFMIFIAGLDRKYIVFILATVSLTFVLTVLPLWEKYILATSVTAISIFYRAPYCYYLIGSSLIVLALALGGWVTYKRKYYYWICYASLMFAGSLCASIIAHKILKEYQIMRLIVFMDPSIDPKGSGWNILQSITAIGSGGLSGKGYLKGTQSHYRYLPQQNTDFIFSIIAEEWGFLGGFAVFALFFTLLQRCIMLLKSVRDRYAIHIVAGIFGMLFFHFMINVGMAMGIMPITGIPLFFLSYGGSSLWAVMIAIGLLLNISARRYRI